MASSLWVVLRTRGVSDYRLSVHRSAFTAYTVLANGFDLVSVLWAIDEQKKLMG